MPPGNHHHHHVNVTRRGTACIHHGTPSGRVYADNIESNTDVIKTTTSSFREELEERMINNTNVVVGWETTKWSSSTDSNEGGGGGGRGRKRKFGKINDGIDLNLSLMSMNMKQDEGEGGEVKETNWDGEEVDSKLSLSLSLSLSSGNYSLDLNGPSKFSKLNVGSGRASTLDLTI